MNVEKELVKNYFKIKNPNEGGILKVIDLEIAIEIAEKAVEDAKKTNWKYPENNELPKQNAYVIAVTKGDPHTSEVFCFRPHMPEESQWIDGIFGWVGSSNYYTSKQIICWCELPVLNNA